MALVDQHTAVLQSVIHNPVIHTSANTLSGAALVLAATGLLNPILGAIATFLAIVWYSVMINDRFKLTAHLRSLRFIGRKATATHDAKIDLAAAKDAVKAADALPKDEKK